MSLQESSGPIAVHWFRRDLRVAGNVLLRKNLKEYSGRVLGLFCFDSQFLARPDFSHHRFAFFMDTLRALRQELRELGSDLLVVDGPPQDALPQMIDFFKKHKSYSLGRMTFHRDYEPFARARDHRIESILKEENINYLIERDHLLIEPQEIFKNNKPGEFYQVYSPFAKKWMELAQTPSIRPRIESQKVGLNYLEDIAEGKVQKIFSLTWQEVQNLKLDSTNAFTQALKTGSVLDDFCLENTKQVTIPIPKAGSKAVLSALKDFKLKIRDYGNQRDIPSVEGTSRFSMYLKNGSLTVPQIIAYFNLENMEFKNPSGPTKFLKELIWREFYYSILWNKPQVEQSCFLEKYNKIKWQNSEKYFDFWMHGKTGFPIVDAGMRELKTTGWMHNRVRMIVASFLCKDLLITWQWGENHFMKFLLDGDLAPNNGGWQWAASTGCDPQPYFRIFNPWLQSAKFDPQGIYIKKFIPELANASSTSLHDPDADRSRWSYPAPIVSHSVQRDKALKLYDV